VFGGDPPVARRITSKGGRCPAFAMRAFDWPDRVRRTPSSRKRPSGKSSSNSLFNRVSTSAGPELEWASDRTMPRVDDINKAAAVPLPETSASTRPQRPSGSGMKSYQSTAHCACGNGQPGHAKAGNARGTPLHQSLLNCARLVRFPGQLPPQLMLIVGSAVNSARRRRHASTALQQGVGGPQ